MKTLFTTTDGFPISHGMHYWVACSDDKTGYNKCIADDKFDYSDDVDRFYLEESMKNAIDVFKWLNNEPVKD